MNKSFTPDSTIETTLIKVDDAYKAFSKLLEFYNQVKLDKSGIEQPSFIHASAQIGENIYLGSFSYIGENAIIGEGVKIYPNVFIGDNVIIGNNTTLFAGSKIYSESIIGKQLYYAFGCYCWRRWIWVSYQTKNGVYNKIPQIGNVIIEDHVDIGSATTIDRATLGSTIVRKGVKLDNQIQIAHNV